MHIAHRRTPVVIAGFLGAVLALGLSACTPPAPASTTSPTAGASGAPAPTASATPTATAVALAPPTVRVGVTCDQVAPLAQIQTALGANVIASPDTEGSSLQKYAYIQDGALDCEYLGTATNSQIQYDVDVMPDTTATRWNKYKGYLKDGATIPSPFGANSYVNCESSTADLKCNLDMLIGTTWLSISDFTDQVSSTPTLTQALARFKPVLQAAVSAVQSATVVEPRWSDPSATAVNIADTVAFQHSLYVATGLKYGTEVYVPDAIANGPSVEAFYPIGYQEFGGGAGKYGITIEVLPAGLWAWSDLNSSASSLPEYAALPGIGDEAIGYNGGGAQTANDFEVAAVKGHNLITIDVESGKKLSSTLPAVAKKMAAAVLAQIN